MHSRQTPDCSATSTANSCLRHNSCLRQTLLHRSVQELHWNCSGLALTRSESTLTLTAISGLWWLPNNAAPLSYRKSCVYLETAYVQLLKFCADRSVVFWYLMSSRLWTQIVILQVNAYFTFHAMYHFVFWRLRKNTVEWARNAEIGNFDLLAVGEACDAVFVTPPDLRERSVDSTGLSAEGALICVSVAQTLRGCKHIKYLPEYTFICCTKLASLLQFKEIVLWKSYT